MPENRQPGRNPRQGMTTRALRSRYQKPTRKPRRGAAPHGKKRAKPN